MARVVELFAQRFFADQAAISISPDSRNFQKLGPRYPLQVQRVVDLFVHSSGRSSELLVPLLDAVFEPLNRSSGISAEVFLAAAQRDRFIKAGADTLLARLGGDVEGRATLTAVVLASGGLGGTVALDLVLF